MVLLHLSHPRRPNRTASVPDGTYPLSRPAKRLGTLPGGDRTSAPARAIGLHPLWVTGVSGPVYINGPDLVGGVTAPGGRLLDSPPGCLALGQLTRCGVASRCPMNAGYGTLLSSGR
jgi:hypothetical protein